MHGHDPGRRLKAILTALLGELEVVQATAADLNCTEANSAAIAALLTDIDNNTDTIEALLAGELEVVQATAADLNVTEASAAAIKTALELIDDTILDHGSLDTGTKCSKVGYRALNHGAMPTAVDNNDRTHGLASREGVPFVIGGAPGITRFGAKYTTAQTDTALVTVNENYRFVLTEFGAFCDNANSVDVGVLLEFDAASDVRILEHPGIAPGSGFVRGNGDGILAIGGDGQDLIVTVEVPTGGSVCVDGAGYLTAD